MVLKNIVIFSGGILIGIFMGVLLIGWIAKVGMRDQELPEVKIMRIKRDSKTLYVANPKGYSDTIHALFIMLGWHVGLIRKNSVYYEDAKASKIAANIFVLIAVTIILLSIYWIFRIISHHGHIM